MRDEDFERTLDAWANHEIESAPQMRPTAEMYRMVQARQHRRRLSLVLARPTIVASAVASLAVLVVLYAVFIRPTTSPHRQPVQELAYVGQREGPASGKGIVVKEPAVPRGKGPERELVFFRRLWFQFQQQDSPIVESLDLQAPQEEAITLTSADNYRLFLESSRDCYVYIFQLTTTDILARLFPNETYNPIQNRLQQGQTVYLPAEPNWFHLGKETGEEYLYVIASAQPLQDLDGLYTQYREADDQANRQELLSSLLKELQAITDTEMDQVAGWAFSLNHQ